MSMVIVGDLHVGSRHFVRDRFLRFLERLPTEATLVLNGDTVHHPDDFPALRDKDMEVLHAIRDQTPERRVVWIIGNHDRFFRLADPGKIEFRSFLVDETNNLHVSHGWEFLPFYHLTRLAALMLRPLNIAFQGGEGPLSPRLAKKLPALFRMLNHGTMRNAVKFAQKNGYKAVACGHTHAAAKVTINNITYLNHGTWTEWPAFYLFVDGNEMSLRQADEIM